MYTKFKNRPNQTGDIWLSNLESSCVASGPRWKVRLQLEGRACLPTFQLRPGSGPLSAPEADPAQAGVALCSQPSAGGQRLSSGLPLGVEMENVQRALSAPGCSRLSSPSSYPGHLVTGLAQTRFPIFLLLTSGCSWNQVLG